ncbi:glycine/sarcosine/betaine reductase selenoprotein B family protein [Guptibacillus algicola]|uniref:glycine/sarcosine/betaine reductase selenoprotein B family protein n=1 Tax=Guptibacillus algicola TaxID=225844 RepID=UPI001CD25975|nr:glycine/sarcosine/betaine reductase selenoprotein B family protein [Alkalihalobacillus algicola]MCA0987702.1 glycine/betaine/sarcosine/D-proline family reductase selenoprotein B [Alkalihalobacillus algicola]
MIEKVEQAVRENWVPSFRYEKNETTPFTPFTKDLSQAKGAIVSTGGIYVKGQTPFTDHFGLGDPSYREIPVSAANKDLSFSHEHYDQTNVRQDPNVLFPLERMNELVAEGRIGELADTHYSFMGYIPTPHPLKQVTAPEVAQKLLQQNVDFALLVPS